MKCHRVGRSRVQRGTNQRVVNNIFQMMEKSIPRDPQMSQSIPEELVFPALPLLSRRGSTHYTMERGSALWESLVGKPRGKATDPLIHATGSVTLLLQFLRRAHVHAPT